MKLKVGNEIQFLHQGIKKVKSITIDRQWDFDDNYGPSEESFESKGFNLDYFWDIPDNSPYIDSDFSIWVNFEDGSNQYLNEGYIIHTIRKKRYPYFSELYCKNESYTKIDKINHAINQLTFDFKGYSKTYPFAIDLISFFYFIPNYVEITLDCLIQYFLFTIRSVELDYFVYETILMLVNKSILYIQSSKENNKIVKYQLDRKYRKKIDKALAGIV